MPEETELPGGRELSAGRARRRDSRADVARGLIERPAAAAVAVEVEERPGFVESGLQFV
jgi:hypothetical protein